MSNSLGSHSHQKYLSKENYVTVLAIHDDPKPFDGVVEITNIENPPTNGLKVSTEADGSMNKKRVSIPITAELPGGHLVDSKKSDDFLARNQARKSKFTDAFLDAAHERLESQLIYSQERSESRQNYPENQHASDSRTNSLTFTLSAKTVGLPLGIEISPVPDPNDNHGIKILAVEVRQIDDDGRIALDGKIKVGDLITQIHHRPVYQMSLPKAQARLRELQSVPEPVLVVNRRAKLAGKERSASVGRPIAASLQIANTAQLGDTMSVQVQKGQNGFGFGVKSRVNAMNERLIYINNVNVNGPAYNKLKIGDRLLKINDTDVGSYSQKDVVNMLKDVTPGSIVDFHISRIIEEQISQNNDIIDTKPEETQSSASTITDVCHKRRKSAFVDKEDKDVEYLFFDVALQGSKSAGLGISLKGGKLYPETKKLEDGVDCGLFVNGILHGSAAFYDGRFRENDRLVGIEDLDLRNFQYNADALAAFSKCLAEVTGQIVKIRVARAKEKRPEIAPRRVHLVRSDSEASVAPDNDIFNRENPNRKSISEKRPFGSKNEAINTQTYQKIIHQRQTSAPQIRSDYQKLVALEIKQRQSSLIMANKKLATGSVGDENSSPGATKSSSSKRTAFTQLLDHFRSGSKKDKARRQTIMVLDDADKEQRGRSQSLNPRTSNKESKVIFEKNPESNVVNRRKKIEPAPSFKQAMSNSVSHPIFDLPSGSDVDKMKVKMNDKTARKSIGSSLPRLLDDRYKLDPPPYNGPHHRVPQIYNAFNRDFEHQRLHSAQEFETKVPPPVPPRRIRGKYNDFCFHTQPIQDIYMKGTDIKATPVVTSNTINQVENTGQICTISITPQTPMSARYHSNNNSVTQINNIHSSYNNANEFLRISGLTPNLAPILRKPPPIPPRTIMTSSMPGSLKVDNNNIQRNTDKKLTGIELQSSSPKLRHRTRAPSPPPLTNQSALNMDTRPRLVNPAKLPTSAQLHRAPSPHFPLHIMPQRDFDTHENISFPTKSQNRNSYSLLNWVRRKSTDSASCRPNNRRIRAPSAIFYDSEEPPVEC
uniref:PDZ domain-containing protein n=1 Tax=Panagrolaimus sp. JU765 TaxID=591449 RepID=A0AC34QHA4_9BILA